MTTTEQLKQTPAPLSEERLSEIRERAKARTPGNWYWEARKAEKIIQLLSTAAWRPRVLTFVRWGMTCAAPRFIDRVNDILVRAERFFGPPDRHGYSDIDHPDAQFIAHAAEDVDTLLAEVDRLRGMVAGDMPGQAPGEEDVNP